MNNETGQSIVPYIESATLEEVLGTESLRQLENDELRERIEQIMGVSVEKIPGNGLIVISLLFDDSGSMSRLVEIIRQAQHRLIDRLLKEAPYPESIIISTQALNNEHVTHPSNNSDQSQWAAVYRPLSDAIRLDGKNYFANGGTPLVPRVIEFAHAFLMKGQEARDARKRSVRTLSLTMGDGQDTSRMPAKEASGPINDANRSGRDIPTSLCICDEYNEEELRRFFEEMGFRSKWNMAARPNPEDVNRKLDLFIDAAIQATSEANFQLLLTQGLGIVGRTEAGQ